MTNLPPVVVIRADAIALKCACHGLPFAYLQDGYMIIASRHHGEKCISAVPLVNVLEMRLEVRPDGKQAS